MNNMTLAGYIYSVPRIKLIRLKDKVINVCNFVVRVEDSASIDYFECICFDEAATLIVNNFVKGAKIVLSGKLKNYHFEDNNGTKHFTQVCVFTHAEPGDVSVPNKTRKKATTVSTDIYIEDKSNVFNTYNALAESGILCINDDDYYRLAFSCDL